MSILSNILGALVPSPAAPTLVSGDAVAGGNNDFTGTAKNDNVVFDATVNVGEDFKAAKADFSTLDGGAGFDTLTIKLTESQNAAMKLEMKAKLGSMFNGGLDLNELVTLFKIATGQQAVKFESIGAELKGWECIKFDVVKDPVINLPPALAAKPPEDNGNNAAKDDYVGLNGHTTFTLNDLLNNDPGGANKNHNLYFGDSADPASQQAYLAAHGITKTSEADGGTYQIAIGATDINYHVQIGNNGTWSTAHVFVTAPVNHAPVAVVDVKAVVEDAEPVSGNILTNDTDQDAGQTVKVQQVNGTAIGATDTTIHGVYGDLTIKSDGSYSYAATNAAAQALGAGVPATETFNYTAIDSLGGVSNSTTLKFNITGVNDAAHLTPDVKNMVEGDTAADISASGKLLITDVDSGQATFQSQTDKAGQFGHFSIGTDGAWTYTADSAHNEFVAGTTYTDVFSVKSADGTETSVTINILGTDEATTQVCYTAGAELAKWDFESDTATYNSGQAVNAPNGWQSVTQWAIDNGVNDSYSGTVEIVKDDASHLISGYGAGETQWLDTAASPGNIWIQLSDDNRHTNIQEDALLSFSVSKQMFGDGSGGANGGENSHTDADAYVEILWNYEVVKTVHASDLADPNKFYNFSAVVHANGNMDTDQLMIRSGGTGTSSQGLAIDHIVLNELTKCDTHHNGALAAEWTFENHTQSGGDNVGTPNGFWNLNQWAADHKGIGYGEDADTFGFSSDIQVHGEDGHRALDTAASPGNIFLQAIPEGRGGVLGQGATMPDLVAGKEYHAEVMIAKQHFTDPALIADGHEGTDPDAWVAFQFNNTTLNVHASDIHVDNEFVKFDVVFKGVEGEDGFSIMSHGTQDDPQGLLIDSIRVHDWVV